MPSSDPITIPKVMQLVQKLNPLSILDIGAGNGRYGFLFREMLDWNYGRISRDRWYVQIDAIEVESAYITPVHEYVYSTVFVRDWEKRNGHFVGQYDLIFMGDVLEHFKDWKWALDDALVHADHVIVVCPNWEGSIAQGAWHGYESEIHRHELTPALVGGKCVFANSKCFISAFGDAFNSRDILL